MTLHFNYSKLDSIRNVCLSIYKITNLLNKKIYIGKSKGKLIGRIIKHCHHVRAGTNRYLYDAIRHYGWDNFSVEVLEVCKLEELDEREIFWISLLSSNNKDFGYNMTEGGDGGGDGKALIQAAKDRIGIPMPKAQRQKISDANKGRSPHPMTEDIKSKISKALNGIMPSRPIHIIMKELELPHAMTGRKHSVESKRLMSLHNDHKAHQSLELRNQMSENWKGASNPLWVEISKDELISAIKLNLSLKDTALKLKISIPTIYVKIKSLLECDGLVAARKLLRDETISLHRKN